MYPMTCFAMNYDIMNKSLVLCYAFNPITKCEVIKEYYSQFLYSRGNSTLPGETGETSQKYGCAMDAGFPSSCSAARSVA